MRLLCFLITLVAFFLSAGTVSAHTTTVTIRMTADGFSPDEISIDQGSTLVFINADTVDRWPASNPHPSHTNYLQFDPKQPIAPGGSWSFKAERAGIFRFHDHLFPHKQGVLTVLAEEKTTTTTSPTPKPTLVVKRPFIYSIVTFFETIMKNIAGFFARVQMSPSPSPTHIQNVDSVSFRALDEQAQFKYFESIINISGGETAWAYLVRVYTEKGTVIPASGRAHDLAHFIGEKVFEKQGMPGIAVCEPLFAYGCFHGFTEGAFAASLDKLPDVAAACAEVGQVNSGPWASCIHGIGHGIATFVRAKDLQKALDACAQLSDGAQYCEDGVFMEFSVNAPQTFYSADAPLYPCSTLLSKYRSSCGRNQPAVMRNRFNLPFLQMVKACAGASDADLRASCLDATGLLVGQEAAGNVETITARCGQIQDLEIRVVCTTGAAVETVFQAYAGWQNAAPSICNFLPNPYAKNCTTRVQQTIKDYGK